MTITMKITKFLLVGVICGLLGFPIFVMAGDTPTHIIQFYPPIPLTFDGGGTTDNTSPSQNPIHSLKVMELGEKSNTGITYDDFFKSILKVNKYIPHDFAVGPIYYYNSDPLVLKGKEFSPNFALDIVAVPYYYRDGDYQPGSGKPTPWLTPYQDYWEWFKDTHGPGDPLVDLFGGIFDFVDIDEAFATGGALPIPYPGGAVNPLIGFQEGIKEAIIKGAKDIDYGGVLNNVFKQKTNKPCGKGEDVAVILSNGNQDPVTEGKAELVPELSPGGIPWIPAEIKAKADSYFPSSAYCLKRNGEDPILVDVLQDQFYLNDPDCFASPIPPAKVDRCLHHYSRPVVAVLNETAGLKDVDGKPAPIFHLLYGFPSTNVHQSPKQKTIPANYAHSESKADSDATRPSSFVSGEFAYNQVGLGYTVPLGRDIAVLHRRAPDDIYEMCLADPSLQASDKVVRNYLHGMHSEFIGFFQLLMGNGLEGLNPEIYYFHGPADDVDLPVCQGYIDTWVNKGDLNFETDYDHFKPLCLGIRPSHVTSGHINQQPPSTLAAGAYPPLPDLVVAEYNDVVVIDDYRGGQPSLEDYHTYTMSKGLSQGGPALTPGLPEWPVVPQETTIGDFEGDGWQDVAVRFLDGLGLQFDWKIYFQWLWPRHVSPSPVGFFIDDHCQEVPPAGSGEYYCAPMGSNPGTSPMRVHCIKDPTLPNLYHCDDASVSSCVASDNAPAAATDATDITDWGNTDGVGMTQCSLGSLLIPMFEAAGGSSPIAEGMMSLLEDSINWFTNYGHYNSHSAVKILKNRGTNGSYPGELSNMDSDYIELANNVVPLTWQFPNTDINLNFLDLGVGLDSRFSMVVALKDVAMGPYVSTFDAADIVDFTGMSGPDGKDDLILGFANSYYTLIIPGTEHGLKNSMAIPRLGVTPRYAKQINDMVKPFDKWMKCVFTPVGGGGPSCSGGDAYINPFTTFPQALIAMFSGINHLEVPDARNMGKLGPWDESYNVGPDGGNGSVNMRDEEGKIDSLRDIVVTAGFPWKNMTDLPFALKYTGLDFFVHKLLDTWSDDIIAGEDVETYDPFALLDESMEQDLWALFGFQEARAQNAGTSAVAQEDNVFGINAMGLFKDVGGVKTATIRLNKGDFSAGTSPLPWADIKPDGAMDLGILLDLLQGNGGGQLGQLPAGGGTGSASAAAMGNDADDCKVKCENIIPQFNCSYSDVNICYCEPISQKMCDDLKNSESPAFVFYPGGPLLGSCEAPCAPPAPVDDSCCPRPSLVTTDSHLATCTYNLADNSCSCTSVPPKHCADYMNSKPGTYPGPWEEEPDDESVCNRYCDEDAATMGGEMCGDHECPAGCALTADGSQCICPNIPGEEICNDLIAAGVITTPPWYMDIALKECALSCVQADCPLGCPADCIVLPEPVTGDSTCYCAENAAGECPAPYKEILNEAEPDNYPDVLEAMGTPPAPKEICAKACNPKKKECYGPCCPDMDTPDLKKLWALVAFPEEQNVILQKRTCATEFLEFSALKDAGNIEALKGYKFSSLCDPCVLENKTCCEQTNLFMLGAVGFDDVKAACDEVLCPVDNPMTKIDEHWCCQAALEGKVPADCKDVDVKDPDGPDIDLSGGVGGDATEVLDVTQGACTAEVTRFADRVKDNANMVWVDSEITIKLSPTLSSGATKTIAIGGADYTVEVYRTKGSAKGVVHFVEGGNFATGHGSEGVVSLGKKQINGLTDSNLIHTFSLPIEGSYGLEFHISDSDGKPVAKPCLFAAEAVRYGQGGGFCSLNPVWRIRASGPSGAVSTANGRKKK